jgi:regulator of sigma E protease
MITLLAIDWAVVGIKAVQLLLCLSILVVLHEMGHFLPAKWFKCRVEKFYLFFDPWFSIFKKKIGDTVYGIGWLPLGGYVKISGMIDESMDKEQMKQAPQPWEFRSKPAWQRLIIMIGGVTVNVILGFLLFAMILFVWGERKLPMANLPHGIATNVISEKAGLKSGDKILSIDGQPAEDYFSLTKDVILNEAQVLQIERDGQKMDLPVPKGTINSLIKRKAQLVDPRVYTIVDTVVRSVTNFTQDSLVKGDRIIGLNGNTVIYFDEFLKSKKELKNQEISLTVLRGSDTVEVRAKTDSNAAVGFNTDIYKQAGAYDQRYGFFASIPAGISKGWETLTMNVKNFKLLFTSDEVKASESLGSFISIGNMFADQWDWQRFWTMTALLSMVLAFMNILPIPALDGGHVMFTLYEMITGRKPGEKFLEYAQMVGMVLLLALMAYAFGLDIWRTITGKG